MPEGRFSDRFLCQSLKRQISPERSIVFDRLWTDSRTLGPGDFFICLKGERFDAHEFIPDALRKGVKGFLVQEKTADVFPEDVLVLRSTDVLAAFRTIAACWRKRFSIPVIAVCGNVGKTTAKEMLAALMSGKFRTAKTENSQNGFAGIPMTLAAWDPEIDAAVVEIGIDERGAMEQHLEIVRPTHGLITALGPEHLEKLEDVGGAIEEEVRLFSRLLETGGRGFVNLDEPELCRRYSKENRLKNYSLRDKKADFFGRLDDGTLAVHFRDNVYRLPLPMAGIHNARNLLGAAALAIDLGLSEDEMQRGLASFRAPANRMAIRKTRRGVTFICDCYNANPSSMEAAFALLESDYRGIPKIVVLGDMLELGAQEEMFHRALAEPLCRLSPKKVFLLGERMRWLADELGKKGADFPVRALSGKRMAADEIGGELMEGDAVLFKGSRGMRLEEIVDCLKI